MATKIEWCDEVLNVTAGCTKCSPGCLNCYAERMAKRLAGMEEKAGREPRYGAVVDNKGWMGNVICDESLLNKPLHWKKPRRIFIDSMSDLFHEKVSFEFITKVLRIIEQCPQHTFLILTKRPEVAFDFYGGTSGAGLSAPPLPNVHFGVSISNQAEADEKIPMLLQIPAAVRWLSIEPMLGSIDLAGTDKSRMGKTGYLANYFIPFFCNHCGRHISRPPDTIMSTCGYCGGYGEGHRQEKSIHGVIVGGESGPGARPMHPDWPRSIRDQCVAAGVPFYFKQWGEWLSGEDKYALKINTYQGYYPKRVIRIENVNYFRVGKKLAGDLLDGKIWKQLPK